MKDFSGVASAGVDAGDLLQDLGQTGLDVLGAAHAAGPLSGWGSAIRAGSRRRPGRVSRGLGWGVRLGAAHGSTMTWPAKVRPGAVAEHAARGRRDLASPDSSSARQRQRDRGGRRVARPDDVAGDDRALGEAEPLGHRLDDPQVGLVRGEDVDVVGADAGPLHRLDQGLGELRGGPAVDRLAGHGHAVLARRRSRWPCAGRRRCPRRPGRCPARRTAPTTAAPAPSAKITAVARSVEVGDVGEPLDADDQGVAGRAGADGVVGRRRARSRSRRSRR